MIQQSARNMIVRISRRCKSLFLAVFVILVFFIVTFTCLSSNNQIQNSHLDCFSDKLQESIEAATIDSNNSLNFTYKSPVTQLVGKPFHLDKSWLKHLKLPPNDFVELTNETIKSFVFATAATEDFVPGVLDAIATIQNHMQNHKIFFYDLGISHENVRKIKKICNVTYKKFNFNVYPRHVKHLYTYAWKPLIIMEVLREHPGVLWMDSSIRMTSGDFEGIYNKIKMTKGALHFTTTGHSSYAVTHPDMYLYLPSYIYGLAEMEQREATLILYRTASMYDNVLQWYTYCALVGECIAPPSSDRGCQFHKDRKHKYANCHRYDQSLINILLGNYLGFDSKKFYSDKNVFKVERGSGNTKEVHFC